MLDRLSPRPGARQRTKRVGRGPGPGHRKTSGRGIKGQGKRSSGREVPLHSEGGQMPITRRLPKRGFHPLLRGAVHMEIVNVGRLTAFSEGAQVDVAALVARGLVRANTPVKLLAEGDAPRGLKVQVHAASAGARKKIEDAGGSVEIVGGSAEAEA
jgi:large subunit ribosomal protein L15